MDNSHADAAKEAAKPTSEEPAAMEASIARIEQKSTDLVAVLEEVLARLNAFMDTRLQEVRTYSGYEHCTSVNQTGNITELIEWWNATRDWDSTTLRHFQHAWTVQSLVLSVRACSATSRPLASAKERLCALKNTSAPYDNVLNGRARYEAMSKRKTAIQTTIEDILEEVQLAKKISEEYKIEYLKDERLVSYSLVERFTTADYATKKDMLVKCWKEAFASVSEPDELPEPLPSRKEINEISVFIRLSFMHELDFLAPELDKVVVALENEVPRAVAEMETQKAEEAKAAERTKNIRIKATEMAVAAAHKINMFLAKEKQERKENAGKADVAGEETKD